MREYAWLDFHGGFWHLITSHAKNPQRHWTRRDSALSDLAAEGWIIEDSDGKEPTIKHEADRHFYGYALRRTVH